MRDPACCLASPSLIDWVNMTKCISVIEPSVGTTTTATSPDGHRTFHSHAPAMAA
ncbi:MAG: hypothetical protein ACLQFR_00720 [Streptosporangiaceae bacterium]